MAIGLHTLVDLVLSSIITVILSILTRYVIKSIAPFEPFINVVPMLALTDTLYKSIKLIPVETLTEVDDKTGNRSMDESSRIGSVKRLTLRWSV